MPMGLAVGFQPQLRLKMCLLLCLPKTMELVLDLRPRLQLRMCLLLSLEDSLEDDELEDESDT